MRILWNSALGLLLVTGTLLGLTLPFARLAGAAGASAMLWALVISGGAGCVLFLALCLRGQGVPLDGRRLRYFVVTAAVSYAVPNLLLVSTVSHLGVGYTGVMYTLSPVFTLVFSILLRLRRPNRLGIAGIAVGFAGAVLVTLTRGRAETPAEPFWVLMGLMLPVFLAAGNVYRSLDWPENTGPIQLAAGSHLTAAAMLLVGIMALEGPGAFGPLGELPLLVAAQVASASLMFAFFFRLQAVGGPVYLSQISYIAAALGLLSGTAFLGECYGLLTWAGAAVIAVGVLMTTRAQSRTG